MDGYKLACSQAIAVAETPRCRTGRTRDYSGRFPGILVVVPGHLDFETPRDDHEDAYLWITPGTDDRDEISDIWGFG